LSSWVLMKLFPTFFFGLFFNNWLYESSYLIIAVASAGIMRPLGEELLFRKYFLGKFTQKYSTPLAVIFSSLLFGLRKLDPFLFVIYGGIGLINGAVFIRSNIRVAVIANITTSLLIILVTLIYKGF